MADGADADAVKMEGGHGIGTRCSSSTELEFSKSVKMSSRLSMAFASSSCVDISSSVRKHCSMSLSVNSARRSLLSEKMSSHPEHETWPSGGVECEVEESGLFL